MRRQVAVGPDRAARRGEQQRHEALGAQLLGEGQHGIRVGGGVDDDGDRAALDRPGAAQLRERGAGRDVVDVDGRLGRRHPQACRDVGGELAVDAGEREQLALADGLVVALAELEGVGLHDVVLLDRRHALPEQAGLAEVVVERRRQLAHLGAGGHGLRHVEEGAVGVAGDERAAAVERVGAVGRHATVDGGLVHAVAQDVVDRRVRAVDRQLVEVRAAEPGELGVEVGEQPRLQQRVVGDVDAGHEVADVEGDLLGLGEEVGRRAASSVSRPSGCTGASSSGTSLVGSSRSMPSKVWSSVSSKACTPSSHCG